MSNTSYGIYSILKELTHTTVFLSINNETQFVLLTLLVTEICDTRSIFNLR